MSHDIPQPGLSQGEGDRTLRLWKHQRGIGWTTNRVPKNVTGEILFPAERMQVRAGIKARFKRILKVIVALIVQEIRRACVVGRQANITFQGRQLSRKIEKSFKKPRFSPHFVKF